MGLSLRYSGASHPQVVSPVKSECLTKDFPNTKLARYGSSSTPISVLQELSAAVTRQLETWYKQLPPSLQLRSGTKTPSEVLLLQ